MFKMYYLLSPYIFLKNMKLKKEIKKLQFLGKKCNIFWDVSIIGAKNISIGDNVVISKQCKLHTWNEYNYCETGYKSSLIIGNNVYIGDGSYLTVLNKTIIGDGTCLGDNVFISDNSHGNPNDRVSDADIPVLKRKLFSKGPIIIGKNVWIGRNSCILGNVTIGDNAIIGAGSIVTHDVEKNSVYAGVPAKKIK